ncbi:MAG TPA: periplasmic heavy metal sensor [Terriglobales bacterium]|nr:periplasmic heavy metal sensor [Terriglobales bacterium]
MKTKWVVAVSTLVLAGIGWAQETGIVTAGPGHPGKGAHVMMMRREMGKWWQNPDVVSKLGLSDSQITQLDQVFYNHKMKLIDYGADMEKQDLKLQNLLDADQPDEGQVNAQVDHVLAARGKLEREFTAMNLDLRKQLSLEQWRQLKTVRGGGAMPGDNMFFFRQKLMPGGPDEMPLPPPPPPGLE